MAAVPAPGAHYAQPLLMAAEGTKGCPERDRGAMALQQPPLALRGGSGPALYIHSMPAWVLEDFCQKMDCLSDYDWMRFGEGDMGQVGWRRGWRSPSRWRGRGGTGTAARLGRAGSGLLRAIPHSSQRSAEHIL